MVSPVFACRGREKGIREGSIRTSQVDGGRVVEFCLSSAAAAAAAMCPVVDIPSSLVPENE